MMTDLQTPAPRLRVASEPPPSPSTLAEFVTPLVGADDLAPIVARCKDARVVLLGEATHGTHEFYAERARLTQRLIARYGFDAVAIEGDWPDAYRVNRWVRGESDDVDAATALDGFRRFPTWMWRNHVVVGFLDWLATHNRERPSELQTGFYGLDMYSLHTSIAAVLAFLDRVDPGAARRARERYACFDRFGEDPQAYGVSVARGGVETCEDEVVRQLVDMRRAAEVYAARDGQVARDEQFQAEQNARLVRNAEAYYRAMFRGHPSTWNLRDRHMFEVLGALTAHLSRAGQRRSTADQPGRVVVWAHNSHLGDARATSMGARGELNLGQLVREHVPGTVSVGFTTYRGSVTAASSWDGPAERKRVRDGLPGSYEALFHAVARARGARRFLVDMQVPELARALARPQLERAIGVLYLPETERQSHYFGASLAHQFDMVVHIDETRALEPLERGVRWHVEREGPPETWPTGL